MPTPGNKESKPDFIDRCMAYPDMQKYEPDQRAAICNAKWEESKLDSIRKFIGGVSFDYDGVLNTKKGKELAISSNASKKYIISARSDKSGMLATAKEVGISESNVYATGSNEAKVKKIKELGVSTHYDNNPDVIKELGSIGKLWTNS